MKDLIKKFVQRRKAPSLNKSWYSKFISGNLEYNRYTDGTIQIQNHAIGSTVITKGQQSVSIQIF